jgi:hypothetical protein
MPPAPQPRRHAPHQPRPHAHEAPQANDRTHPSKGYRSHLCSYANFASHIFISFFCSERRIWRSSNILLKLMKCLELKVRVRDLMR